MRLLYFLFIFTLLVASSKHSYSLTSSSQTNLLDSSEYIVIEEILITGNKKTKEKIILRECSFKSGDTINTQKFLEEITRSRNRIFNTGLFVTVEIHKIDRDAIRKSLLIVVQERWYIFPVPIFELADRNFNEWWQQRNRDLNRINVGINYIQKNVRGRNETLKAKFQLGFTKKMELFYYIPYLNKKQTTGLNFEISYIINKQIPYKTSNHKLVYFDYHQFVREKFRTGFNFIYRRKYYQTHYFGVGYQLNHISDTIAVLNPKYLLNSQTSQEYLSLRYAYIKDLRDIAYYPIKGSFFKLEAEKLGLGIWHSINQFNLIFEYDLFRPLSKKIFFAGEIKQKLSYPTNQPYLQTRALGYEKDYVSGYELFVIDGQHFSLTKLNFKYQLFATKKAINSVGEEKFNSIPFAIYFKLYSDAGFVVDNSYNPENTRLANKFLMGGGAGFDFVSYYDFVMRMECSINKQGQTGFFLHFKSAI